MTNSLKSRPDSSDLFVTENMPEKDPGNLPAPLRQMRAEVVGGPMDGLRAQVDASTLTIGRGSDNDLSVPLDPMTSTHHARIIQEGAHYWLEDAGSRNGTYIGDQKLTARALIAPGATFVVGQTCLEFMPH